MLRGDKYIQCNFVIKKSRLKPTKHVSTPKMEHATSTLFLKIWQLVALHGKDNRHVFSHWSRETCKYQLKFCIVLLIDNDYGCREYEKSNKILPSTQTSLSHPVNNASLNFLQAEMKWIEWNIWNAKIAAKHIKLKRDWIDKMLNEKEETNHLIATNAIYHLVVMITIQQLPEQPNTLCQKGAIPFCQTPYTI